MTPSSGVKLIKTVTVYCYWTCKTINNLINIITLGLRLEQMTLSGV